MFYFIFYILGQYKTQEMCDRIIYDDLFSLRYVPDQYKTPEMCDEAVDDYLAALKKCDSKKCDKAFNKSFISFFYILD